MALELSDLGEQMTRARLRRERPDLEPDEVEALVVRWRQDRPGAPFGDFPGPPSTRTLGPSRQ